MNAEEINALPEHVRDYIHKIETLCDPSGLVRENAQLKDVMRELAASNKALRDSIDCLGGVIQDLQLEMRNR